MRFSLARLTFFTYLCILISESHFPLIGITSIDLGSRLKSHVGRANLIPNAAHLERYTL